MTFQTQPLRSHALYIFIKFANFFIDLRALRFCLIAAAQLFERFFNGEFGRFGHADLTSSYRSLSQLDCARSRRNLL
jgi:hypothetical protein